MTGDGGLACDDQGAPLVVIPPLTLAYTDEKTVTFFHTEQRLSPKRVAAMADVHVATVKRGCTTAICPSPTGLAHVEWRTASLMYRIGWPRGSTARSKLPLSPAPRSSLHLLPDDLKSAENEGIRHITRTTCPANPRRTRGVSPLVGKRSTRSANCGSLAGGSVVSKGDLCLSPAHPT